MKLRKMRANNFTLLGIVTLFAVSVFYPSSFSDPVYAEKKGPMTSVEALGVLQIAAHDFFNVDRCDRISPDCAIEHEDGKLNLSTLLLDPITKEPLPDEEILLGGEERNRESILIFSVSSELGKTYVELKEKHGEEIAYERTLKIYHDKVRKAFVKTFHQPFPDPQDGDVNFNHNLALRSAHDFLPGKVRFDGNYEPIFGLTGKKFSQAELKQYSSPLDGKFDEEFLGIDVCITPSFCINVDLLEADQSFAEQFGTDHSFDHFMEETSDGRYDKNEDVTKLIVELFARGTNLP